MFSIVGFVKRILRFGSAIELQAQDGYLPLSGLPVVVSDDEDLARFARNRSHFNSQGAKWNLFMPSKKHGTTSVFRHLGQPNAELWRTGRDEVAEAGQQLKGVAMIKTSDVREVKLDVSSYEPPEKHADIGNWPTEQTVADSKAAQKEIALRLALLSSFHPSPQETPE